MTVLYCTNLTTDTVIPGEEETAHDEQDQEDECRYGHRHPEILVPDVLGREVVGVQDVVGESVVRDLHGELDSPHDG